MSDNIKLVKILQNYNEVNYIHQCFEASMEILFTLAEQNIFATLVHANIMVEEKLSAHAWIEYNHTVIDLTQPLEYRMTTIDAFYKLAKIQKMIKYSFQEVATLILTTKNQYVWEDWLIEA